MAETALVDLSVLDLTHHIAGPNCTKFLANYGAEVIKIERPDGGDPARRHGPFPHDEPHPEKTARFLLLNTNQRSIPFNLKTSAEKDLFIELVRQVDVVVENFSPRVMPSLGLDYGTLGQLNPRLVMTSISNFGQTGPYRDYKAQDILMYAMGGAMHQTGVAEREPIKMAGNLVQYHSGTMAATATLVGVYGAQVRGTGQHIDVSRFETHAGTVDRRSTFLMGYAYAGEAMRRQDSGLQGMLPRGIYPCQDGYICIHATSEWWPRQARMLERPDSFTNPKFATPAAWMHVEHQGEFDAIFSPWLLERTKQDIEEIYGGMLGLSREELMVLREQGVIYRKVARAMPGYGWAYPDREPGPRPWNRHPMFNPYARNKLGMTVDLSRPKGRELFTKLVSISDVLIENHSARFMENLGLTYDVLSRSKPDLIMVSMPAFGMSGPYKYYQGFGINVESVCGLTWLRAYPDGDLTETSSTLHMDAVSGAGAAFAIMAALHYRRRTGKGQFIDFAQAENLMQSIGESLMDYTMNGRVQSSLGNRPPLCPRTAAILAVGGIAG
jgi:crotonobetainyl-CoA:carnitine CoA-transferase CaiB-like acyl-CoA transferase